MTSEKNPASRAAVNKRGQVFDLESL
jgi:hypothetical protein